MLLTFLTFFFLLFSCFCLPTMFPKVTIPNFSGFWKQNFQLEVSLYLHLPVSFTSVFLKLNHPNFSNSVPFRLHYLVQIYSHTPISLLIFSVLPKKATWKFLPFLFPVTHHPLHVFKLTNISLNTTPMLLPLLYYTHSHHKVLHLALSCCFTGFFWEVTKNRLMTCFLFSSSLRSLWY